MSIFKGVGVALVTPMTEDGINFDEYGRLLDYVIDGGVDAVIVGGTTGEPSTMTEEERIQLFRFAVKHVNHRVPVIIGTGSVGYLRKNGEGALVGGCGYIIDSSLSGYDLGREVLNAVCSEKDGRGEKTLLSELVFAEKNTTIAELVKETYLYGKAYVASFAPFVFTAYEQGDKVAKEILAKCVKEWERLLMGVYKRFGEETCEITLIGGLTKRFDVLSQFLSAEITEKISFKSPEKPIVYGALRRAGLLAERTFLESYRS